MATLPFTNIPQQSQKTTAERTALLVTPQLRLPHRDPASIGSGSLPIPIWAPGSYRMDPRGHRQGGEGPTVSSPHGPATPLAHSWVVLWSPQHTCPQAVLIPGQCMLRARHLTVGPSCQLPAIAPTLER